VANGDAKHHARIMKENYLGALDEFRQGRFSNVGLLCIKSLEQLVEACASKEGLHFHEHPRTAYKNRRSWLRTHHPDLLLYWDELWGIYGALGYGGVDGERAERALSVLEQCIRVLSEREGVSVDDP